MKRSLVTTLILITCSLFSFAQDAAKSEELINEGTKLHDAGKYDEAIIKYNEALTADANHPRALYEMSYTYYLIKKYDSAILLSKKLIEMNASANILENVYVTLGSLYDDMKNSKEAEKTYKQGISKFPDFYLLYFNLGLTYYFENPSNEELALDNFQKGAALNPFHAGSNYWQYKSLVNENKVPAILTACVLCIAEQKTKRSNDCASFIQSALTPDIKSDSSKKNITIYIPASSLTNKKENDFSSAELGLSLMAASSNVMDTLQLTNNASKISFQLQSLFNFLGDNKKQKGFYWKFYAPFFHELNEKKYTDILSHIILMNTDNDSDEWVGINRVIVDDFYNWVKSYQWPKDNN